MAFTAAAETELQKGAVRYSLKLELKTNFSASEGWQEVDYARRSLTIKKSRGGTSEISVRLIDPDFSKRIERSTENRAQLFADCRVKAWIGAESEYVFRGRLEQLHPTDHRLPSSGRCWRARIEESQCVVSLSPTEVQVVADGSYRQVYELAQEPGLFVLATTGPGDEGFDESTSTIRRPWAPANTRIYKWDSDLSDYAELASDHYQIYWPSGSVAIQEQTAGETYYVGNLRCCKESAASGAANVDWSQAVIQALTYGLSAGVFDPELQGMGLSADEYSIGACGLDCPGPYSFSGTVEDLIADIKERVADNLDFDYDSRQGVFTWGWVEQQSSGNEHGTLYHAKSIAQPRNVKQILTAIVVRGQETQPVNQLALHDADGSICNAGDFIKWQDQDTIDNQTFAQVAPFMTDGDSQFGAAAHQLPASEGGGTDFYDSWYGFCKWDFGEELAAQAAYIVAGMSWHEKHQGFKKLTNGAGDTCWLWPGYQLLGSLDDVTYLPIAPALDKVRIRPADRYEVSEDQITRPYLRYVKLVCGAYKHGNNNINDPSIGLLEIALICNVEYEHKLAIYPREHTIADADASANTLSFAGDWTAEAAFQDGEWVEVYDSAAPGSAYQITGTPSYGGGNTTIEVVQAVSGSETGKLLSPVYAYSDHNEDNPHFFRRTHPDLFTRVAGNREMHAITGVDISADSFTIAGDLRSVFADGEELLVGGSTANDGRYTVSGTPAYAGGNTTIAVSEDVSDATADGYLRLLGTHGGHRGVEEDFADTFTSSKGRDAGIQRLAESVRLFDSVTYTTIADCRFDPGQTVIVNDSLNGNVDSILIEEVEIKESQVTYWGTNYRAEALSNS